MPDRALAQKVTSQHYKHDRPADWFDKLYNAAAGDANRIPWGDCAPNPSLLGWKSSHTVAGSNAVVVGCGLGDDAEEVGQWNLKTLAFDISPQAVEWCRRRFPQSAVEYTVGDLFALPKEWVGAFDFVLEIYTVQSLPPEYREHVLASLASLVAPGGSLLTIGLGRDETDDAGGLPWPVTRTELSMLGRHGLRLEEFDDYMDRDERRFRTLWRRESE